jgi:hypothetical protein
MNVLTRVPLRVAGIVPLLCVVLALSSAGCDDNGVSAGPDDRIDVFASPQDVTIDIAGGANSGTTTVSAQLFDSSGFASSGVNVFWSADGGIVHTACDVDTCDVTGDVCAEDVDCVLPTNEPLETDNNGFARVLLTLRTTDPDPTTITASSGSISGNTTVGKVEDEGNQPPVAIIEIDPSQGVLIGNPILFDGSLSDDPDGQIFCYQWEISSSVASNNEVVQGVSARQFSRTYLDEQNLTIILRVSDDPLVQAECAPAPPGTPADVNFFNGSTSTSYRVVCDLTPPVANAGLAQTVTLSGGSADAFLNGALSSDPETLISDYEWDCRNGTVVNGEQAVCTYDRTGVFDVVLQVTNGCNQTSTDTVRITVVNPS